MRNLQSCLGISILIGVFLTLSVSAQDELSLRRGLIHCASLETPDARLICFEALANLVVPEETSKSDAPPPRKVQQPTDPAAPVSATAVPDTQAEKKTEFGAEHIKRSRQAPEEADGNTPAPEKKKEPKGIAYTVVRVTKDGEGRYVFRMENGQVWRQIEPGYIKVPRDNAFQARVTKGTFGDYKLRIKGKGRLSRVVRIK